MTRRAGSHSGTRCRNRLQRSYDPFGDGKTAIRAGAGVFYERIRQNINSFDLLGNPPLSYTATVFNANLDNLGPQDINGVISPAGLNAFDKAGQIPTVVGYSLGVQRELPGQIGLVIGPFAIPIQPECRL